MRASQCFMVNMLSVCYDMINELHHVWHTSAAKINRLRRFSYRVETAVYPLTSHRHHDPVRKRPSVAGYNTVG